MTISGVGGRIHAVEQAESLKHLADELASDLNHWGPHLPDTMVLQLRARIARLREQAAVFDQAVADYDLRHTWKLTPGETDSGVRRPA